MIFHDTGTDRRKIGSTSLADESKDLARRSEECNEKIRDGPRRSPERFYITIYNFAATILFGSSSRYGAGAAAASGLAGCGGLGEEGGGVGGPPRRRQRARSSKQGLAARERT